MKCDLGTTVVQFKMKQNGCPLLWDAPGPPISVLLSLRIERVEAIEYRMLKAV